MKKGFQRIGWLVAASFMLARCADTGSEAMLATDASDRQLLEAYGYDTESMAEYESYYVLRPDLIVSKERLEQWRNDPHTRMRQDPYFGLVNEEHQTIYIMDQYAAPMTEALRAAVEEYNKVHSNLRFVIDNTHVKAVKIECGDDGYGPGVNIISVERPDAKGEYGRFARINFTSYRRWATDVDEGKFAMMHVLGHLAGFAHAVTDFVSSPPDGWIPGTDYMDKHSIMRTENDIVNGVWAWHGLSVPDRKTIEQSFPYKEPGPSFELLCYQGEGSTLDIRYEYVFEVAAQNLKDPNPRYDYSVTRTDTGTADYTLDRLDDDRFFLTIHKSGGYRITVDVTNVAKPCSFHRDFTVVCPDPQITAPDFVRIGSPCEFGIRLKSAEPNYNYRIKVESNGSYEILTKSKDRFSIRFDTAEIYEVTVSSPLSHAKDAQCTVVIHPNPYHKILSISNPMAPISRFYLNFYADEQLTVPFDRSRYFSYYLNLFYHYRRAYDGSIVRTEMTHPIETIEIRPKLHSPTQEIELPARSRDTVIIRSIKPGQNTEMEYFDPYYTVTFPANRIDVLNPSE